VYHHPPYRKMLVAGMCGHGSSSQAKPRATRALSEMEAFTYRLWSISKVPACRAQVPETLEVASVFMASRMLDSSRVDFLDDSSVIPGVHYRWGMYHPPRSAHLSFASVLMTKTGNPDGLIIRSAFDWARGVGSFVPSNSAQALAACTEGVHISDPYRLRAYPRVYTSGESLRDLPLPIDLSRLEAENLEPPRIEPDGNGGWKVSFWAIIMLDTKRFECILTRAGASLNTTRVVRGAGYILG
jgi:hypothetical protein